MARMQDFESDNGNIRSQHQEWQQLRRENSEDPNDWSAFRQHLSSIGAPDPGDEEPEDFRMADDGSMSSGSNTQS